MTALESPSLLLLLQNKRITNASGRSLSPCSYLQVSMPTQFSGLVTSMELYMVSDEMFAFKLRDGSVVHLNKINPAILCSDAFNNLLDEFASADTVLEDMEVTFEYMLEILHAIAKTKGTTRAEIIKEMANQSRLSSATVDRGTGDMVMKKMGIAFPPTVVFKASLSKSNGWGNTDF